MKPNNPTEARLVHEMESLTDAIKKRDWPKADLHRRDISKLLLVLGERGKELQREYRLLEAAKREGRVG